MGAAESKSHHDTNDMPTDDNDANHTPVSYRRVMKLRDPRSPTDEVQRTPIIVPKPGDADDSFEDPRSPTTKIARTPIPDTDPRSPTTGMSRTPCPFTYPDPRSPTVNVARTPMLKESESGKFEMPSSDQIDNIEEEAEKEEGEKEDEEIQNVSNNNSGDTTRLIGPRTNEELATSSQESTTQGPANENELNSQNDVTTDGLTHETEEDDSQRSLLASSKDNEANRPSFTSNDINLVPCHTVSVFWLRTLLDLYASPDLSQGPSKKSRKPSLTKSIKAKINRSNSAPPRSPLTTRNLDKDAPTVHVHTGDGVIIYDKAGSRRRQASGTPTRLVGKYEPMIDKENV